MCRQWTCGGVATTLLHNTAGFGDMSEMECERKREQEGEWKAMMEQWRQVEVNPIAPDAAVILVRASAYYCYY